MTQKQLIDAIARRAQEINDMASEDIVRMDLEACIEGGCKLNLKKMLNASDADLMHDIWGINANLNHETYQLENNFWSRFAK